jgi:class I fructose-bisphosphate aldolase
VRNGTAIFLPYEHGPRDFAGHREPGDPRHVIRLAVEGGFSSIALQIGLAAKFYGEYAGEVPLVLMLNGKTGIPSTAGPVPPASATVEEAVRLGADAVGCTLYAGTPARDRDFARYLRRGRRRPGRQGLVLRGRLRRADRERTGRGHGHGELPPASQAGSSRGRNAPCR